jgi:hypothetical protein
MIAAYLSIFKLIIFGFEALNYDGFVKSRVSSQIVTPASAGASLMFSPAIGRRKKKNADWLFGKKEM